MPCTIHAQVSGFGEIQAQGCTGCRVFKLPSQLPIFADFRPAYLQLRELRDLAPGVPVIAVTATATQLVRESIVGACLSMAAEFLRSLACANWKAGNGPLHDLWRCFARRCSFPFISLSVSPVAFDIAFIQICPSSQRAESVDLKDPVVIHGSFNRPNMCVRSGPGRRMLGLRSRKVATRVHLPPFVETSGVAFKIRWFALPLAAVTTCASRSSVEMVPRMIACRCETSWALAGTFFARRSFRWMPLSFSLLSFSAFQDLVEFLESTGNSSGIVYARLRKTCDHLASLLVEAGVDAAAYHAGKDPDRRKRVRLGGRSGEMLKRLNDHRDSMMRRVLWHLYWYRLAADFVSSPPVSYPPCLPPFPSVDVHADSKRVGLGALPHSRGHHRVRHGNRQVGRALGGALEPPIERRRLLPGEWKVCFESLTSFSIVRSPSAGELPRWGGAILAFFISMLAMQLLFFSPCLDSIAEAEETVCRAAALCTAAKPSSRKTRGWNAAAAAEAQQPWLHASWCVRCGKPCNARRGEGSQPAPFKASVALPHFRAR